MPPSKEEEEEEEEELHCTGQDKTRQREIRRIE
jgi:hypothetical protein